MKYLLIVTMVLFFATACQQKEEQPVTEQKVTEQEMAEQPATKPPAVKEKEPKLRACSKEARMCPDGRTIGRNPKNNCEFDSCDKKSVKKEMVMCTADVKECPDGSFIGRDHYNNCKFKDCPPDDNGRESETTSN
ncbi:hypothetical protein MNBD_GAMMA01-829 [hydrothermal vent metagenome]|uniref:Uncharacterized protein n=1 Tax=hydrothermal vent metagenome TaxID=652676 RepID=A0A3B0WFL0_9ZZZZ